MSVQAVETSLRPVSQTARTQASTATNRPRRRRLRVSRIISDTLLPQEEVLAYAEGLVKVRYHLFERCVVVLSDHRLLIFQPRWPFGYKLDYPFEVDAGTLLNYRRRLDRSTLAVVHEGAETRCLFFPGTWRRQAEDMLAFLRAS